MEEKNPQTPTLDDLVTQLIRPSIIKPPGQDAEIQIPSKITPPTQDIKKEINLPPLSRGVQLPEISKSVPSPLPSVSEGTLLIRTMAEDLARLRGQKSTSPPPEIEKIVDKKLLPEEEIKVTPDNKVSLPEDLRLSASLPVRPDTLPVQLPPELQPERPSFLSKMLFFGKKERSKEAVSIPGPEHHHWEEVIGKVDDLLPPFPGASVPKKIAKTPEEKVEYGVIARVIGSGMTTGIIITIVMAVAAYIVLTLFVFNQDQVVTTSFSPTPTQVVKTPEINELEAIFRSIAVVNFVLPTDNKILDNFRSFIRGTQLSQGEFKRVNFVPSYQANSPNFTDLLDKFLVRYPSNLAGVIENNNMTFLYGQQEILGEITALPDSDLTAKKAIFIVELTDSDRALQILREWEPNMPGNFKEIFNIDPARKASLQFIDNEHRGVKIRYMNFPLPDRSIDYAIVGSLTGRHYLVIANSRESMYSPAEKIRGF